MVEQGRIYDMISQVVWVTELNLDTGVELRLFTDHQRNHRQVSTSQCTRSPLRKASNTESA